ncbi:hypothetical protein COT69_03200 [candidate division WWE3 bacterium CG09_land_8_20_14_0_10_39_24]|uniref:ATP-grasp domain-containing protein n=2 Tax=Katanobacteria TaxID=422282 RepID=A0A2G9XD02_UNCKA|nr:MAG: hypothetical protein BK003_03045 [bacterium CG09_39_24]PIP04878.1 MAG: hypothetical protein COX53_00030 [candidate division WWE3 bacterium CG23_combo_of_CG06-09_8_20_14_all_40_14]PIS12607.1 MAG: hypothetical protein COT69_03200 [candidate division WWE3 bacterium CG09_land_8_20_14_0_10_39_24]
MPRDLSTFFYPTSVAVIGASRSPQKVGAITLKNIQNSKFKGRIYPVNPNAEEVNSLKCYKSIKNLPETPELAIIAIPAPLVPKILKECADKQINNVIILAAGFKETGSEGGKLENELINIASKHNINLLGPNCLGFINTIHPINATFGATVARKGNLRFISQSGAVAASIFDWCNSIELGISQFVTLGNKAVLNESDFLSHFEKEYQNTSYTPPQEGMSEESPIGMYLESISDGKEFLKTSCRLSKTRPLFILKPGKTKEAAQAMLSHTGALAGEDSVLSAVLEQAGVIQCKTIEDFFDLAKAFSWENVPNGPSIAIISNAGGPAVISADAVLSAGLALSEFNEPTKKVLTKILPRSAGILNPVDILGDALANRYRKASETVMKLNSVNALLVILTPQIMTEIEKTAEFIGELSKQYKKPIFCSFIGGKLIYEGEKVLNKYKIPSFRFPERAIYAISEMWKFKKRKLEASPLKEANYAGELNFEKAEKILRKAINEKQQSLDNISANNLIASIGIPTPPTKFIKDEKEALVFAKENGWPVALKISSPNLLHKKKVGGVATGIANEKQLLETLTKLQTHFEDKIQIQKCVQNGTELLVGVKTDAIFGKVLLFGAGGTYAELFDDKNLCLLPINNLGAKRLMEKSKIYKFLQDAKLEKLQDLIIRLGALAQEFSEISEIEINPVIATLNEVWAVDSKTLLRCG